MHMKNIRIYFEDVHGGFNRESNRFIEALSRNYHVIMDSKDPEILFYSCFGRNHLKYPQPLRIFFSGENLYPDYNICDYSIGTQRDSVSGRNLFQPGCLYLFKKTELPAIDRSMAKRKFCCFIYSQDSMGEGARLRKEFCRKLMETYRHVDCPGKILHNIDAPNLEGRADDRFWHDSKVRFLSEYKFNIAFENTNSDGYITEKMIDPFMANCVPIYWGSEGHTVPFPKDAMICASDYPDFASLIARIMEIDQNDDLYLSMLARNPIRHDLIPDPIDVLAAFLFRVIESRRIITKDPGCRDPIRSVIDFATMSPRKLLWMRRIGKILGLLIK